MRLRAKNLQVVHKVVNKLWNGIRFRTQMPKIFALSERKRRNWLGNGTDHVSTHALPVLHGRFWENFMLWRCIKCSWGRKLKFALLCVTFELLAKHRGYCPPEIGQLLIIL